jgi:hypothetical protein
VPARDPPCGTSRFREICEHLRSKCPPPRGIRIRFRRLAREHLKGDHGETTQRGRTISVAVADNLTEVETIDTLIHEYAHAMTWRPFHALMHDHDAMWGVAFAQIYTAYHGTR